MDTPLRILVAEDELSDVMLPRMAFAKALVKVPIYFARDGQEVMDYLEGKPPFDNPVEHPLPNLLLLDLKLPRVSGFEVLEWLRGHRTLSRLLVVVFGESRQPADVARAYSLGANSYIVKPKGTNWCA
jgi:CheY-like chemotaxis protein